ncbi:transposase [Desulfitispora alkaliphila]
MLRAYKYRIYPNREQREYFSKCFGCERHNIYREWLFETA